MAKQSPCCARAKARVGAEQAEVRRLARLAVRAEDSARYQAQIVEAKARLEEQKRNLIDHEADHAGERPERAGFPDGYLDALAGQPRSFA